MGSLGDALKKQKISGRPVVPDGMLCDVCHWMKLTDAALAWMGEHMPENLSPPVKEGGPPTMSKYGIRCKCETDMEEYKRQYDADRLRRLYQANLPARRVAGTRTFKNWMAVEGAWDATRAAEQWSNRVGAPIQFMVGVTGCGKSHLLEAAARAALNRDMTVYYTVAGDLLDDLRLRFNRTADDKRSFEEQVEYLGTIEGLVIDDLGIRPASLWALGMLVSIIDRRYRDEAWTLIASNKLTPDALIGWAMSGVSGRVQYELDEAREAGSRLASRLFDKGSGVVAQAFNDAPDYRAIRRE